MKVSISYTVDFEDVPEEIMKMVHKARDEYENLMFSDVLSPLEGENYGVAIDQIHEFRTKLADVDLCLNDVVAILNGYMKAKYSEAPTTEPPQIQPPTVASGPVASPEEFDMDKTLEELRKTSPNLFPKRKGD